MDRNKEMTIIIADDDDGHAELIKEGLQNSGVVNPFLRFSHGEELWDFFNGKKIHDSTFDRSKAYLLLLDINMPRMDGIEVLKRMKEDDHLKEIPVMMLTTTDDPREVEKCYRLGCNVYITKPVDFAVFAETLRRIGLFIQVVKA
jgi:CheY-like chemotaxis protein